MARNNEDRVGANTATGATAPPTPVATAESSAGGLSFATPTEFVELPSRGRFYAKGHPLHGEETLEIRFMTAKEEDILTSKALLKKGLAIDRMLQNLIINYREIIPSLYQRAQHFSNIIPRKRQGPIHIIR